VSEANHTMTSAKIQNTSMSNNTNNDDKVLVACATGKCGFQSCLALIKEGYDVYGTTRSESGAEKLKSIGVTPIVGDYATDLSQCIAKSGGAKKLLFITDYFLAAGGNADVEYRQGKQMVDAAVSNGVEHAVFVSSECVSDLDAWPRECEHIHAKAKVEAYLATSDLPCWSVVRPVVFFENLDDPANYNPLTKGSLKFAMTEAVNWCSTYDVGRAAAVQFRQPRAWHGRHLNVIGHAGDLDSVADALERVGGFPVRRGLAVPRCLRRLAIGKDLHYMCEFFAGRMAGGPGTRGAPGDFRKHVPDALDAEGWFRHRGRYANGEPIVGNAVPPPTSGRSLAAVIAVAAMVAGVAVALVSNFGNGVY